MPDWTQYRTNGCLFEKTPSPAPTLKAPTDNLPQHVDLRAVCPQIEDQGQTGSCVANAIVGALEVHQRKARLPVTDLSRLFLYYNARALDKKEHEDCGSFIHKGMAALMAFGVCEERMWPYLEPMFSTRPTEAAYQNATHYEAVQFARTPRGKSALAALAQGLPVAFGMSVPGNCYHAAGETGVMPMPEELPDPGQPSGHAMLLVGYDLGKESYLVRNSWGERWGENGYCWISFRIMDAWSQPDHFWAIGAIEQAPGFSLMGPSIAESVENVTSKVQGPSPLDMLRGQLRERLNTKLDAARADFRNRLRGGR
jgi:C1A family cysteine protease